MCPNGDEYELDSDFEDEDEASSPMELGATLTSLPCERNLVITLEGRSSILILPARAQLKDTGQTNNRKAALKDPGLLLSWMEVSDTSSLLCGFSITSSQRQGLGS